MLKTSKRIELQITCVKDKLMKSFVFHADEKMIFPIFKLIYLLYLIYLNYFVRKIST